MNFEYYSKWTSYVIIGWIVNICIGLPQSGLRKNEGRVQLYDIAGIFSSNKMFFSQYKGWSLTTHHRNDTKNIPIGRQFAEISLIENTLHFHVGEIDMSQSRFSEDVGICFSSFPSLCSVWDYASSPRKQRVEQFQSLEFLYNCIIGSVEGAFWKLNDLGLLDHIADISIDSVQFAFGRFIYFYCHFFFSLSLALQLEFT